MFFLFNKHIFVLKETNSRALKLLQTYSFKTNKTSSDGGDFRADGGDFRADGGDTNLMVVTLI